MAIRAISVSLRSETYSLSRSNLSTINVTSDTAAGASVVTQRVSVVASGTIGQTGATGPAGPVYQIFTVPSTLNTGVSKARFYAPIGFTVSNVRVSVGTAPTGSSIVVDVLKNGSTIFTTSGNRPTINVGSFVDNSSVPDYPAGVLVAGDYLTISIVQVGSSVAGSDLTVQIELQPT